MGNRTSDLFVEVTKVADAIPEWDRKQVYGIFQKFEEELAKDNDDKITYEQMKSLLTNLGLPITKDNEDVVQKLWKICDDDDTNDINFRQFATGLSLLINSDRQDMVELSFQIWAKGKPYLEREDLRQLVKSLNVQAKNITGQNDVDNEAAINKAIETLLAECDKSHNGKIYFSEYRDMMSRVEPQKPKPSAKA